MTKDQLIRNLNSVGKGCFIKYFDDFMNLSIPNFEVADKIYSENQYTQKSCTSRTSHARSIVQHGLVKEALEIIISARVPQYTSDQAEMLLNENIII